MTVHEFLNKEYFYLIIDSQDTNIDSKDIEKAMQEYAKMKCKELLDIVVDKAKTKTIYESNDQPSSSFGDYEYDVVDKDSILNAVDLDSFIV